MNQPSHENNLETWEARFQAYLKEHPSDDGSHDLSHFQRVWKLAHRLSSPQDDSLVILASCYFHDIVSYPKNDPRRSQSSQDAALKTQSILRSMDFPEDKLEHVAQCIESHSYSANLPTQSREAELVQDADRMESLGAIGLARTFYVAGRMNSLLFSPTDPFAKNRELNDSKYAIDHFYNKLFKLADTMKTPEGQAEAKKRTRVLEHFLEDLKSEL